MAKVVRQGGMRVAACAAVACMAMLVFLATPASAKATTQRIVISEVEVIPGEVNPCTGDVGTVTFTSDGFMHITELPNGTFHVTGTFQHTLTFVPDDPLNESATGKGTSWFGENLNAENSNSTNTFHLHLRGTEGTRTTERGVAHITLNANGIVTVEFERFSESAVCA